MNWIVAKLIDRLDEPSTYRGLFAIAGLIGYSVAPELQEHIITALIAAFAAIEMIRKEKDKPIAKALEVIGEQLTKEVNQNQPQTIDTPELTDEQRQQLNSP